MRTLFVLALAACSGETPGTTPAEPEPATPDEGTVDAGTAAAVAEASLGADAVAAGACSQTDFADGQAPRVEAVAVGDDTFWVVTCEEHAYQGTFEIWNADGPSAVPMGEGTLGGLGVPQIDADARTVTWFAKAAGAGQCGDYFIYALDGTLKEHRSRSCSAPGDVPPPSEWPQLAPAPSGTVTAVENGDVSCYIGLRQTDGSEAMYSANFDLCDETLVGKQITLQMGLGNVMGDTCEGNPDCDDSVEVALATGLTETAAP